MPEKTSEKKPVQEFLGMRQEKIHDEKKRHHAEIEGLKQEKEKAMRDLCDHIAKTAENGMIEEKDVDRERGEMTSDEIYSMHQNRIRKIDDDVEDHRRNLSELDRREREMLSDGTSHSTIMTLTNDALSYRINVDDLEGFLELNEKNGLNAPIGEYEKAKIGDLEPVARRLSEKYPHLFEKDGRMKEYVRQRLNLIKW